MAVEVFSDLVLSNEAIAADVRGKNHRKNSRVVTDSGAASANIDWTRTLREFEIGAVAMPPADWKYLEGLHEITEGGAYGFLLEDPKDHRVATGEGKISLASSIYQLQKRNTTTGSSRYKDRPITRPKTGVVVSYNGVAMSGGTYTVSVTTGQVTFTTPPADPTLLSWTGQFYVPVQFAEDFIDWEIVRPGEFAGRLIAGPAVAMVEIRE